MLRNGQSSVLYRKKNEACVLYWVARSLSINLLEDHERQRGGRLKTDEAGNIRCSFRIRKERQEPDKQWPKGREDLWYKRNFKGKWIVNIRKESLAEKRGEKLMKLLSQEGLGDSWGKQISLAWRREGIRSKGCRGSCNYTSGDMEGI